MLSIEGEFVTQNNDCIRLSYQASLQVINVACKTFKNCDFFVVILTLDSNFHICIRPTWYKKNAVSNFVSMINMKVLIQEINKRIERNCSYQHDMRYVITWSIWISCVNTLLVEKGHKLTSFRRNSSDRNKKEYDQGHPSCWWYNTWTIAYHRNWNHDKIEIVESVITFI